MCTNENAREISGPLCGYGSFVIGRGNGMFEYSVGDRGCGVYYNFSKLYRMRCSDYKLLNNCYILEIIVYNVCSW